MAYRYLGNKARLAGWVVDAIASRVAAGATVADPMCGTAAVSRELADRGYRVLAADLLRFPTLHARARLLVDEAFDDEVGFGPVGTYADAHAALDALPPEDGLFSREYGMGGTPANGSRPRRYFTAENAGRIDGARRALREWRAAGMPDAAVDLLLHDLVRAVNTVANVAGTYGFYRADLNPAAARRLTFTPSPRARDRGPGAGHRVEQGAVEDLAATIEADVVYLDPPYTKRQYAGVFHIPETIAREDDPEPVGVGGLRDWSDARSDFCSYRRARQALSDTVKRLEVPLVVVSYSEDGVVPPERLRETLDEHGRVTRLERPRGRFRSNGGREGPVHEHLYVVEKR